jgi:hypothetical protein
LTRRGLTVSGATLALVLAEARASAIALERMASSIIQAAARMSGGIAASNGVASIAASTLADQLINSMLLAKIKCFSGVLCALGAVAVAYGGMATGQTAALRPDSLAASTKVEHVAFAGFHPADEFVAESANRVAESDQAEMTDGFITRPGEYKLYDGKLVVKVWEEKGRIHWSAIFPAGTGTDKTTLGSGDHIRKGSPWFLYPVSAEVIWVYEPGEKRMILIKRRSPDDFVMKHAELPAGWKGVFNIEPKVPEKVVERLPQALRPSATNK